MRPANDDRPFVIFLVFFKTRIVVLLVFAIGTEEGRRMHNTTVSYAAQRHVYPPKQCKNDPGVRGYVLCGGYAPYATSSYLEIRIGAMVQKVIGP